jgi:glycine/D-amino acid oxidase-like deaminating enzyme
MTEIVVIGGGVIGCAVAWELARAGARATVVDGNGDVGHGSTSASCGIVRRFYSTPTMTAMAHEGAGIWADWPAYLGLESEAQLAVFERPGMLFIPPRIDERVRGIVAHMGAIGVPVELLAGAEVAERFPYLDDYSQMPIRRPGDEDFFESSGRQIEGAVFEPDAGYVVSPMLATQNLRQAGERAGVGFRLGRRVVAVEHRDRGPRFRLRLEDGAQLEADVVVNVAGPHSAIVNRMVGCELQLETRPLRREVCAVSNPRAGQASPVPVVGDLDSGIYFRPESGGQDLIVGSLDPECDVLEWVDDPDQLDISSTPAAFERQVLRMMKRFPEVELGPRRGLAGMYDVTTLDWNPVIDRTDLPGYYVATGTSGSSFKTAPVIGAVVAHLIDACEAGADHDREPLRMDLPRVGFDLDLGFFSRLRGAHASSSTVLG